MNRTVTAFLAGLFVLGVSAASYAQGYPVPAKTPSTLVQCPSCGGNGAPAQTVGYVAPPITTFTGRFLDSTATTTWFQPIRTHRADIVQIFPALNRIYFRYGGALVSAYQLSTFFTRLEASEPLQFPFPNNRPSQPEVFLRWDAYFNPEMNGWKTVQADGETRTSAFDTDDQGYVYIAATIYGWGIVKDALDTSGSTMSTALGVQQFPTTKTIGGVVDHTYDTAPKVILALKSGSRYYAYLGGITNGAAALWDVTNRHNPQPLPVTIPQLPLSRSQSARNSAGDHVAYVNASSALVIYDVASLAASGAPTFTSSTAGYTAVASDGTNFYALKGVGATAILDVYAPSGTLLASNPIVAPSSLAMLRVNEGYAVMTGTTTSGPWDLFLYKLNASYVPTQIATPTFANGQIATSYFQGYYSAPPAGFTNPNYLNIVDGMVYRATTGKLYLIMCGRGLGDVYELQAGDAINATNDGPRGTPNASAPAATPNSVFYGDPVQFTGRTTSTNIASISWNFGNPEAGTVNIQQTSAPNSPLTYQYSNLTKSNIGSKSVSASNITDTSVRGTTTVNLQMPAARFGIAATPPLKFLFAAPNASSPAPIVAGDSFVDASDGTVESHYASWTLDGQTTTTTPGTGIAVGQCGSHSLIFTTHYGPYSNVGGVLTTQHPASASGNPGDFIVGLDPANPANSTFNYLVKPFAAVIDSLGSDALNVNFGGANSRGINSSAVAAAGGYTWTWELINSTGGLAFGPLSGQAPAVPIQNFAVPKQTFVSGLTNLQVRLTLQTVQPLTGSCAGLEKTVALTAPLNAPDPKIGPSGDGVNTPYTFTAGSVSSADMSGWTFKWTVNGAAPDNLNVSAVSTTGSTFAPTFLKAGSYQIGLTATNAINSVPATPVIVTVNVASCKPLTSSSFLPGFSGAVCSSANSTPCTLNESVTFTASTFGTGYDPSCGVHTYTWTFPDGPATTQEVQITHPATASGQVTLKVTNPSGASVTYPALNLIVGGNNNQNPCTGMSLNNIFVNWSGPSCTGGTCATGDNLTFSVAPVGYDASCLSGATWTFGDGSGAGVTTSHRYAADGAHPGSVRVTNTAGENVTRPFSVTTIPGSGNTSNCGSMTNSTVFVNISGASCPNGGTCSNGDTLTFGAVGYGYDFNCATHTYDWDFGDGSAHSTSGNPTHVYSTAGAHNGTVTLKNLSTNQTFPRTFAVTTQAGNSGPCAHVTPNITLSITYADANGTCGPLGGACNVGQALNFTMVTYQYDIGCATHTYDWNFGDGTSHSTQAAPTHQYASAGTYHASCVVNNGNSYTLTQDVVIGNTNPGTGSVTPTIAIESWTGVPNGFVFTAHFDHPELVKSWAWNFGDGTTKTVTTDSAASPTAVKYAYSDAKPYTVTLTSYGSSGQPNGTDNVPNEPTAPPKRRSVKH